MPTSTIKIRHSPPSHVKPPLNPSIPPREAPTKLFSLVSSLPSASIRVPPRSSVVSSLSISSFASLRALRAFAFQTSSPFGTRNQELRTKKLPSLFSCVLCLPPVPKKNFNRRTQRSAHWRISKPIHGPSLLDSLAPVSAMKPAEAPRKSPSIPPTSALSCSKSLIFHLRNGNRGAGVSPACQFPPSKPPSPILVSSTTLRQPIQGTHHPTSVHARCHMRVNFSRLDVLVTQQLLNGPQIRAPFQQMRCKTVA